MSLVETKTAARSALKALLDSEAPLMQASRSPSFKKSKGSPRLLVMMSYGNTRQEGQARRVRAYRSTVEFGKV